MFKIKKLFNKSWIFITTAAIIVGSSSAMAFALNNNIPESISVNVPSTSATKEILETQNFIEEATAEYIVIDRSKSEPEKDIIKEKLKSDGISKELLEEKCNDILSNMIPGKRDISAEQAAAFAAAIVKKAYGVDLTGYTADTSFSRSPIPNNDNWGVIFHAPNEVNYSVSVDSVNGTMLNLGFYTLDYAEEDSENLEDPSWKTTAEKEIGKLLKKDISIVNSKVVLASKAGGVIVVCELSDGSACAVRLVGENKEAVAYIYFPSGYDGSLDYTPISENGVG